MCWDGPLKFNGNNNAWKHNLASIKVWSNNEEKIAIGEEKCIVWARKQKQLNFASEKNKWHEEINELIQSKRRVDTKKITSEIKRNICCSIKE